MRGIPDAEGDIRLADRWLRDTVMSVCRKAYPR